MIQRENVGNSFVQVLGLIQQGLSVKGCNVFVEIGRKEIQIPDSRLKSIGILLNVALEVSGCFGGKWSDLLVASSVTSNEEYRNTLDLQTVIPCSIERPGLSYHCVLIDAPFPIEIQRVLAREACVLCIEA